MGAVIGFITFVEHQLFLQVGQQSVRLVLVGGRKDNACKFSQCLKVHWQEYVHDDGFCMFARPFPNEHDVVVFNDEFYPFFVEPSEIGIHKVLEVITAKLRKVLFQAGDAPGLVRFGFLDGRLQPDGLLHFGQPFVVFALFFWAQVTFQAHAAPPLCSFRKSFKAGAASRANAG